MHLKGMIRGLVLIISNFVSQIQSPLTVGEQIFELLDEKEGFFYHTLSH